jgi:hypothetical protein
MSAAAGIAVPLGLFASMILVAGGLHILRKGGDRLKGSLMILAAIVLAGNVAILAV